MSNETLKQRQFLVIEDDSGMNASLRRKLEKLGWRTDCASNGEEGLARMREKVYDGILMDLFMPVKDGFAVLTEKSTTKNAATPVYVLTSLSEDQYELARHLGAKRCFAKQDWTPAAVVAEICQDQQAR
ncbi:MAG: response regulator [Planctomycetota bacterium]